MQRRLKLWDLVVVAALVLMVCGHVLAVVESEPWRKCSTACWMT